MKGSDNQVCWYRKGMNQFFSQKGFVHFYGGFPVSEDYKEGTPFTFNMHEKTFGRCELVFDRDRADRISKAITSEMRETII